VTKFESTTLQSLVRVFFMQHPDPKFPNITYPAKPRIPVDRINKLMEKFPGGYFTLTPEKGIEQYLELDYQLNREVSGDLKAWKEKLDSERKSS